jgi:hypothetical protein
MCTSGAAASTVMMIDFKVSTSNVLLLYVRQQSELRNKVVDLPSMV